MNIGQAVAAIKEGKQVRRAGWNGKGMHIYLEDGSVSTIGDGVFKGQKRETAPVVCLYGASGVHQPGWVCSQQDLLANDWELVA